MRLNLLPTTVKKGTQTRAAVFISAIIAAACIAVAVFLVIDSGNAKKYAQEASDAKEAPYTETKALQQASVDQLALVAGLQRNVSLYKAMDKHVDEYPRLYTALKPYIPDFFRLTQIDAQASGSDTVVTMTGVIGSFQEYADLMLALLRIPRPYGQVTSISRAGYQHTEATVPPIDEEDQSGRPRKPGSNPVPDDPLKRLEYYINQGATTPNGYQALNNYGSGQPGARGPRQDESLITVRLVLPYPIQTPDPRATLALFAGSGASATPGGAPGAAPGGAGRNLPAPGGAATRGGGRGD